MTKDDLFKLIRLGWLKGLDHLGRLKLSENAGLKNGKIIFDENSQIVSDNFVEGIVGTKIGYETSEFDNLVVHNLLSAKRVQFEQVLNIENNMIVLNYGFEGSPTLDSGIQVERGELPDAYFIWDEDGDKWQVSENGVNYYDILHSGNYASYLDSRYYTESEIDSILSNNYVPYTGANNDVDLGNYDLILTDLMINGVGYLYNTPHDNSDIKSIINKEYVDLAVTSLGAAYYMYDDEDSTGYKTCYLDPSGDAEVYDEYSGLVDDQYLGGWISAPGEAPQKLLKGVYNWFLTLEKMEGNKTLRVYWKLFERKSDNTEQEIAASSLSDEIDGRASYIVPLQLDEDYIPDAGSRIVGKLYANVSGSGNAPTLRIYYQGTTSSRWEIPANTEIFKNIFIPYTGAVQDVDLGSYGLTTNNLTIGSLSGVLKASSGVVSGEATTDDLPEGSGNLYWTQGRFDTAFAGKTTDDLDEGSNNLYFTTARARQSISANAPILYNNSTGVISHETSSQGDLTLSDGNVLASIDLDGYGHIKGLTTKNLDDRYYTETEADNRFVNVTGDTMTGDLTINNGSLIISNLTAGYLPYHTASGLTDSPIYTDGTKVGIGITTPPTHKLEIKGAAVGAETIVDILADDGGRAIALGKDSNDSGFILLTDGSQNEKVDLEAGGDSYILGNVAIGTTDPQAYKLYVNGAGYYADDLVLNDLIQSSNFDSGIFGSGWRIDKSESYLEIDNIMVRNTLRTHIFQKDIVKATSGYLYISDSGVISDVSNISNNKISFADDKSASFEIGDQLWMKDYKSDGNIVSVKFTITEVGSSSGGQTDYTVQVDEGSLSDLQVGQTAVRISGGNILLDASSQYSPYIDILDEGEELVTNGDFSDYNGTIDDGIEDTFSGWSLIEIDGDAEWYAVSDAPTGYSTAIKYVQAIAPTNSWKHKIQQMFSYTSGKRYRIVFWAKASENAVLMVRDDDQSNGGLTKDVNITTVWQKFTYYFTANSNSKGVFFFLGGDSHDKYITGVSVKEISHLETRLGNLEGIANCSGYGLYGENTYLTNRLLIGDLTKTNHYMEYIDGVLTIKGNADISGTIHANDGDIAGWTIDSDKLYKNNIEINSGGYIKASSGGTTYWSLNNDGSGSLAQGNISWDVNGDLSVNKVTATSGTIGGWNIDSSKLYAGNLELNSAGDIQANYTEGSSGFKLSADGSAEFNNVIARGTIYATAGEIAGNLVASGINADNITTGTLSADRIGAGTITGDKIASNTITADNIASKTITANEISVDNLSSLSADIGTVTAGIIQDSDPAHKIILDLNNKILRVNDGGNDIVTLGLIDSVADIYGIRGYEGTDIIFELSTHAQKIGGWSFDKDKLYSGDFLIDGTNKIIKTANTGHRVVIDGENEFIKLYDSSDNEVLWIDGELFSTTSGTIGGIRLKYSGRFEERTENDSSDTDLSLIDFVGSNTGLKRTGELAGVRINITNSPTTPGSINHYGGYFRISSATEGTVCGIFAVAYNTQTSDNAYAGYFKGKTKVEGNLEVTGNIDAPNNTQTLSPTRSYLAFGYASGISSSGTVECYTVDGVQNGKGYRMIRSGKITGVSIQFNASTIADITSVSATVYKNGSSTSVSCSKEFDGTEGSGSYGAHNTGSVEFSAGDTIMVKVSNDGFIEFGDIAVIVEIET